MSNQKKIQKILVLILSLLLFTSVLSQVSLVEASNGKLIKSGDCGENLRYELFENDSDRYRLDIIAKSGSGTAKMRDYEYDEIATDESPPWNFARTKITEVNFQNYSSWLWGTRNITSIGKYAFDGFESLTSIEIPSTVESIGDNAFSFCKNLTSIEIPSTVKSIGNNAFEYCKSLTSIEIPSSVESIGLCAFYNCTNLKTLIVPNSVEHIGPLAFSYSGLDSIYLPSKFKDTVNMFNIPQTTKVYFYEEGKSSDGLNWKALFSEDGESITLNISGNAAMKNYPDIGETPWAKYNDKIEKVNIEGSISSIGNFAFANCTKLENVHLSDSVEKIGIAAFMGCINLDQCTLTNVKTIENYAFSDCKKISAITLSDQLQTIGIGTFGGCENLKQIQIGSGVKTINDYAFSDCKNLTAITVPNNVDNMKANIFKGCTSLKYIYLPDKFDDQHIKNTDIYRNSTNQFDKIQEHLGIPEKTIILFVSDDGTTSTTIKNKDQRIYLREESDGSSAWYYIVNNNDFLPGSKFWVRWLSLESDPEDWIKYAMQIDSDPDKQQDILRAQDGWIFLMGVTDPDGNEYKKLAKEVGVGVQLGENWNENNLKAFCILPGKDEEIETINASNFKWPDDVTSDIAIMRIPHFSAYLLTGADNESENTNSNDNQTSQQINDLSNNQTDKLQSTQQDDTYVSKTADFVTAETLFELQLFMILAALGLWISLKKRTYKIKSSKRQSIS